MPSLNKVSLFINDGSGGWTESYYDTTTNPTLIATLARARNLAKLRSAMLATGCAVDCGPCEQPSLFAIRVSNILQPRQTFYVSVSGVLGANGPDGISIPPVSSSLVVLPGGDSPPDVPWTGISCLITLNNGHQSKRTITGVPDALTCDRGFNQAGPWISAAQSFFKELCGGNWGAVTPTPAGGPNPLLPIASWINTSQGFAQFTLQAGSALPVACSNKFVVTGYKAVRGTPNVNGISVASPLTAGDPTSLSWNLSKRTTPLNPLCNGSVYMYVPTVTSFVTAFMTGLTRKNRGRPFDLLRGRSRGGSRR